jgi:hypothetical protein
LTPISPESLRRRRLVTRALPVFLLAAGAFVAGLIVGADSPERDAARRFVSAWESQDFASMYRELTPASKSRTSSSGFSDEYARAQRIATIQSVDGGEPDGPSTIDGREVVSVPMTVLTTAFGEIAAELQLPVVGAEIEWDPSLVFPGLAEGEVLERNTRTPERAAILAADGTALAEGQGATRGSPLGVAALNVAGELGEPDREQAAALAEAGFAEGTLTGVSGLELAFNSRLAGVPGGTLVAIGGPSSGGPVDGEPAATGDGGLERVIAQTEPQNGLPLQTTIDADLQQASVSALGELFGGAAVLDAESGAVLALAGIAYSSPQPPGSTFKIVTTTAALEDSVVALDDQFPVETEALVEGRPIANAHDELCGGSFEDSFVNSCNSVFAPLGVDVGGDALVDAAERYGFNSPPTLYNAEATAAVDPPTRSAPRSTSPSPRSARGRCRRRRFRWPRSPRRSPPAGSAPRRRSSRAPSCERTPSPSRSPPRTSRRRFAT